MKQKLALIFFFTCVILSSCFDKKLIKKSISHDDITLNWYYHSYITTTSDEIIELNNGNVSVMVTKTFEGVIKDISISNDTIYIKYNPYEKTYRNEIFLKGYIFGYVVDYTLTQ